RQGSREIHRAFRVRCGVLAVPDYRAAAAAGAGSVDERASVVLKSCGEELGGRPREVIGQKMDRVGQGGVGFSGGDARGWLRRTGREAGANVHRRAEIKILERLLCLLDERSVDGIELQLALIHPEIAPEVQVLHPKLRP